MDNFKKYILLTARIFVAVGGLTLVFWSQDWGELGRVFASISVKHFVFTLVVFMFGQVGGAVRWWLLLRAQFIKLKIWTVIRLHFLGLFYNNLMPSSIGGDVLKAWYVTKHSDKRFEAALSVFVDRVIGLCGIFVMALFSYVFFLRENVLSTKSVGKNTLFSDNSAYIHLIIYSFIVLAAIFLILILYRRSRTIFIDLWRRILSHLFRLAGRTKEAIKIYCKRPLFLLGALGLTLVFQSCTILAFWIFGRSIRIEASLKYYFMIFPSMWVVGAIPISVAGIGILEGGITVFFVQLANATREQAACLALCHRFVFILTSLPGAFIQLLGSHLPKKFSFDIEKPGVKKAALRKVANFLFAIIVIGLFY